MMIVAEIYVKDQSASSTRSDAVLNSPNWVATEKYSCCGCHNAGAWAIHDNLQHTKSCILIIRTSLTQQETNNESRNVDISATYDLATASWCHEQARYTLSNPPALHRAVPGRQRQRAGRCLPGARNSRSCAHTRVSDTNSCTMLQW